MNSAKLSYDKNNNNSIKRKNQIDPLDEAYLRSGPKKRFVWPDALHKDFVLAIYDIGIRSCSISEIFEVLDSLLSSNNNSTPSGNALTESSLYNTDASLLWKEFINQQPYKDDKKKIKEYIEKYLNKLKLFRDKQLFPSFSYYERELKSSSSSSSSTSDNQDENSSSSSSSSSNTSPPTPLISEEQCRTALTSINKQIDRVALTIRMQNVLMNCLKNSIPKQTKLYNKMIEKLFEIDPNMSIPFELKDASNYSAGSNYHNNIFCLPHVSANNTNSTNSKKSTSSNSSTAATTNALLNLSSSISNSISNSSNSSNSSTTSKNNSYSSSSSSSHPSSLTTSNNSSTLPTSIHTFHNQNILDQNNMSMNWNDPYKMSNYSMNSHRLPHMGMNSIPSSLIPPTSSSTNVIPPTSHLHNNNHLTSLPINDPLNDSLSFNPSIISNFHTTPSGRTELNLMSEMKAHMDLHRKLFLKRQNQLSIHGLDPTLDVINDTSTPSHGHPSMNSNLQQHPSSNHQSSSMFMGSANHNNNLNDPYQHSDNIPNELNDFLHSPSPNFDLDTDFNDIFSFLQE